MIGIQYLRLDFKVRTQESQEESVYDLSNLRDSVQSIQLDHSSTQRLQDCHPLQVHSARSTNHSSSTLENTQHETASARSTISLTTLPNPKLFSLKDIPSAICCKLLALYQCPRASPQTIKDRAYGAMFGVVIGDAIGAHILNKVPNRQQLAQALLMQGGGVLGLNPGEGSDQWQINMALAEGLLQGEGNYRPDIVAEKYLEWIESSPRDLPVLVGIALGRIRKDRKNTKAFYGRIGQRLRRQSQMNREKESALGLMRLVPLVLWGLNLREDEFQKLVNDEMKMIAPNQFACELSLLFAFVLRELILTGDLDEAKQQVKRRVSLGSERLKCLWYCIRAGQEPRMHSGNANNIRFPFYFALEEFLKLRPEASNMKQEYINVVTRVLSRGFNTDLNCSVALSLVGAALGYQHTPSYFIHKIVKAPTPNNPKRSRDYWSARVIELTSKLIKQAPYFLNIK